MAIHLSPHHQTNNYQITALEAQLRQQKETETDIRQINQDLENRCRDYESSIRDIQPKYQEALNDRGRFELEVKQATEREVQMRRQRDNKDIELRRIQATQDIIDAQLEDAKARLSNSTIPQAAELQALKAERDRLQKETDNLRERNTNLSKDYDFMRIEYQKGSGTAIALQHELRDAQTQIQDLQKKADANTVKIHEIQGKNEGEYYRGRIKELEAEKANVVRVSEKLDADLTTAKAQLARMQVRHTRGASASVPGSPRVGNGNGAAGNSRNLSRILQDGGGGGGGGSRSHSPVVPEGGRKAFGEWLNQGSNIGR